jgi:hypothetical protein
VNDWSDEETDRPRARITSHCAAFPVDQHRITGKSGIG